MSLHFFAGNNRSADISPAGAISWLVTWISDLAEVATTQSRLPTVVPVVPMCRSRRLACRRTPESSIRSAADRSPSSAPVCTRTGTWLLGPAHDGVGRLNLSKGGDEFRKERLVGLEAEGQLVADTGLIHERAEHLDMAPTVASACEMQPVLH